MCMARACPEREVGVTVRDEGNCCVQHCEALLFTILLCTCSFQPTPWYFRGSAIDRWQVESTIVGTLVLHIAHMLDI